MKATVRFAFALFLMAAESARAQTPVRLTLEDAMARGLVASHRIAESVARGDAAQAAVDQRRAAELPQVSAQAGYTRTNHVMPFGILSPLGFVNVIYPDVPNNYRTHLDLQWPIFTAGRLDGLERAARAEAAASADDVAAARAELRLQITSAYWALVTAIDAVRVMDESVARMDAHLQDVRNQLSAGLVPPNDVLSTEAQQSRQRMLRIQAQSTREVSEAQLAHLAGLPAGTAIEPASSLEPPPLASTAVDALVADARANRPERTALAKRVAAATERETAASFGLRPTVGVGGGLDYARPNPTIFPRQDTWKPSWTASVNLNWPLYDGGKTRADAAEAAAGARAAQERLSEFDASVAVEVRQRLSELESSRAAIEAAGDGVRSATEARRVVEERFRAGVATNTDVIDAQVALLQAELDRTQATANARLAEARLARAVGK